MSRNTAIERAIELAGGTQASLAERAGLSQQYISKLLRNQGSISVDAAIAISRATAGAVLIGDLTPDVVKVVADELARGGASADEAA